MASSSRSSQSTAAIPKASEFVLSANAARFAEALQSGRQEKLGEFSGYQFVVFDLAEGCVIDGSDDRPALLAKLRERYDGDFGSRFLIQRVDARLDG